MELFKLFGIIDVNGEAAIKTIDTVAEKAGAAEKKMQDWQKTAVSVGKGLMAAGATIVGGMSAILVSTTKAGVEIDKLAKQTGRSREELQALGYAAQQEHASLAGLATGLNRLSRNMLDAAAGTGEAKDAFAALGISLVDANGNLRSSTDVLLDVADRFSQMTNETEMTAIAMKLFGRSGAELVPFLRMGGDEIRRLSQEARDLGFVMGEQSVKDLKKFDDQLTALQAGFAGTGRQIAVALLPYAQQLAEWLTNAVKWFNSLPEPMRRTATVATALGGALALVAGPMLLIIGYIPQIQAGLAVLSGAFTPFLIGGAIIAGLTAIAALFLRMKENARLAKLEIASISELAEAEKVRAYWEAEVRKEEARKKAAEERAKLAASGVIGPGRAGQAFAMVPEYNPAALENAKKKLAEATAKVQELKKAQDDAAASSANLSVNLNLAGTKVEKTAYELAKEKFERTVFYENLTLDKQIELWQKSVAVYAKTTEEKFDSDKRLAELQKELEEGKARTEEENRQKRLANAESWIAHEVAMNRMSTEEQIKAYKRILDNYKLTEEEKTKIRRQIETLENQAQQQQMRTALDQYRFEAQLYNFKAADHIEYIKKLLADSRLSAEDRKKLEQDLALWEKTKREEEADDARRQDEANKEAFDRAVEAERQAQEKRKAMHDAWNEYFIESGRKTRREVFAEDVAAAQAELQMALRTGQGIEEADLKLRKAQDALRRQEKQDARDEYDFLVQMGTLSTTERINQVRAWLAEEREGSEAWKKLKLEERSLLKQFYREEAEAVVQRLEPIDTASLEQLQIMRVGLGQAYKDAIALGEDGADAARYYREALERVTVAIDNLLGKEVELFESEQKWRYEHGEITTEQYLAYLHDQLAGAEEFSSKWLQIQAEIEKVTKDQFDKQKQGADEAAARQIAQAKGIADVNFLAAIDMLQTWRDAYVALGEAGKDAVKQIDDTLKEFVERHKQATEEVQTYLAEQEEGSLATRLKALDSEYKAKAAAGVDLVELQKWYHVKLQEITQDELSQRIKNVDEMSEVEVYAVRETLDVILQLIQERVGQESKAAELITAIQEALNQRLLVLMKERREQEQEEYRKRIDDVVSSLQREMEFRKSLGELTWRDELNYLEAIANLDASTHEVRLAGASRYHSALRSMIETASEDELDSLRMVLKDSLTLYQNMGDQGQEMAAAILAGLDLLERQSVIKRYGAEQNLTEWQKQELVKRLEAELATLDMSVEAHRARAEAIKGILTELSVTMPSLEQMTANWSQTLIDGLAKAIVYGEDLGDVFKNLFRQIAEWFLKYRVLMPLLAPMLGGLMPAAGTAGAVLGGGTLHIPMYHKGGVVLDAVMPLARIPIAHEGLRIDEVPIIAQTGERILSREQNKMFEHMLAMPQGIRVETHIHAVDAESFMALTQRHPDAITTVVIREIQRNGAIRRALAGR